MKSRQRFSSALPVLSAFAVFDVMMVPPPESVNFKEYGLKHIETLAKHFYKPERGASNAAGTYAGFNQWATTALGSVQGTCT